MGGVILLLAMFVMFNSEVRAASTTFSVISGGCEYTVVADYECSITALTSSTYMVTTYYLSDPSCTTTLSEDDIANSISNKISDDPTRYFLACNSYYPPCSGQDRDTWIQVEARCMYKYYDGTNIVYEVHPKCYDEGVCTSKYEYCFNGQVVEKVFLGPSIETGNGNCLSTIPPDPTAIGDETACFTVFTNCN